jgi:hypothetical protein
MNLAVSRRSNLWEFCPVGPTLFRNPFTFELVKPKEGVRDAVELEVSDDCDELACICLHIICDQVKMHIGGHTFDWHPILQIGLFELP